MVAVLAAVTFAVAIAPRGTSTVDDDTRENPRPSTPTTATADPVTGRTLTAASPTDGRATRRLPVWVTPDRDLADGQVVGVHGSGFRPNAQVYIVQCTNAAQFEGAAACDSAGFAASTADAQGNVVGIFAVRRRLSISTGTVDCMDGNVDPLAYAAAVEQFGHRPPDFYRPENFTCILAIADMADLDDSGGWPVAFAGQVFLPSTTTTTASGPAASTVPTATTMPSPSAPAPTSAPSAPTSTAAPPSTCVVPTIAPTTPTAPGTTLTLPPPLPSTSVPYCW